MNHGGAQARLKARGTALAAVLTLGVLTLGAGPAMAGDTPDGADGADPAAEARAVGHVVTAAELAQWGRERQDAGALIMAARLLAEVPVRRGEPEGEAPALTAGALLDEAAALAEGNQPVLDAIARLRGITRGVRASPFGRGPIFTVKQIEARETYWFEVDARGGEILRIAAIGDGDTNIDLRIRDDQGVVLCEDGFGDHYPVCTVSPSRGGKMRIDIVNRGDVWTKVQILSN